MQLEKLSQLQSLILEVDKELSDFMESEPSVEDACSVLVEMNFLKRDISTVYDKLSGSVSNLMGSAEEITLENGSKIEKKSSYDRKGWDHKGLASVVAQKVTQLSINMDTGEVTKSPQEIAEDMLTYCAPSYWRIKELGKIGINADNYSEVGELRTSIIVRKPKDK